MSKGWIAIVAIVLTACGTVAQQPAASPAAQPNQVSPISVAPEGVASQVPATPPPPGRWVALPRMSVPRIGFSATLLYDGRGLTGGTATQTVGISPHGAAPATLPAEIYDPASDSWTVAATPAFDRPEYPTATALRDGRVLVVGGQNMYGSTDESRERSEVYNPL